MSKATKRPRRARSESATIPKSAGLILWLLSLTMSVLGGAVLVWDHCERKLAKEMLVWPSVEGKVRLTVIEGARVNKRRFSTIGYLTRMEFKYMVDGTNYVGTRISDQRTWNHDLNDAEKYLAQYLPDVRGTRSGKPGTLDFREVFPAGGTVTVAYDPHDPSRSLLDRANHYVGAVTWLRHITGWPMLFIGAFFAFGFIGGAFFPPEQTDEASTGQPLGRNQRREDGK